MKTLTGRQLYAGMIMTITHAPGFWNYILGRNQHLKGTPMEVVAIDLPFVVLETMERNEASTDVLAMLSGMRSPQSGKCTIVKHRSILDTRGFRFKELSDQFIEEARRGCRSETAESGSEPSPFASEREE